MTDFVMSVFAMRVLQCLEDFVAVFEGEGMIEDAFRDLPEIVVRARELLASDAAKAAR